MSKELTKKEVRENFGSHAAYLTKYWENESRAKTSKEKLEGLAFSLLAALDGSCGAIPSFMVIPMPHKDDKKYCIQHGENYYPESKINPLKGCDIAGSLHEIFHNELEKIG